VVGKSADDWDEHWAAYAASNALNPAQAYRRKLIFELLALGKAPAPVRLLDLGSGSGEFARDVLRERADVVILGLDGSAAGVAMAQRKVPGARFVQQDFTEPMALEQQYRGWATHAVCSEVLEHLDQPEAMLRRVRPYFAKGCKLVVTVPAGPMAAFDRHIGHRRHFTRDLLARTLLGAGLDVVDLRSAGFPFFNLYRLAVIARGNALIEDAVEQHALPRTARATIRMFSLLFRLNVSTTRLGWQLAAIGAEPR